MQKHINFVNKIKEENAFFNQYYAYGEKKITESGFFDLRTLDKETLQCNADSILELDFQRDIEIVETSGTTGTPLKVYWYKDEWIQSNFYTWYLRKKWYNIVPSMKFCTFHSSVSTGIDFGKVDAIITNQNRTLSLGRYLYNDNIIKTYIDMIEEFETEWILGPASVLVILSKYMIKHEIKLPNIRYIELNGEYVDEATYDIIQEAFPKIQISNLYGSTEFNGIAFTCPHGNMHVLEKNVFLEVLVEDELPCIYVTGLINTAMPLIRYKIGDIGELEESNCPCGNKQPILKLRNGRVNEILRLKKNINIDPAAFNSIINDINCEDYIIKKFQIKVLNDSDILVVLLIDEKYASITRFLKLKITNSLKQINSDLNYIIQYIYKEKDLLANKSKFSFVCYD